MSRALPALVLVLVASSMVSSSASTTTLTTFQAMSEGCSGGGDSCGTFPFVPSGSAEYAHRASSDGSLHVSVSTDGGLPVAMCLPAACPPGRYHAEALATVWTDIDVPGGAAAIDVAAAYRLDELLAETEATIGAPRAGLTGALNIVADASCSDGSEITGVLELAIGQGSELGEQLAETTLICATGTLPATRVHVELVLLAGATSDGGSAVATGRAQLVSVQVVV